MVDEKALETGLLVTIFALIILQVLFQSGSSFFPNWSTITGIPTIIPVVMPFLVLILFVFLILAQVRNARPGGR